MRDNTRRGFLKAMLAASTAPAWIPSAAFGANERLALAVVGTGGRGRHLARQFASSTRPAWWRPAMWTRAR